MIFKINVSRLKILCIITFINITIAYAGIPNAYLMNQQTDLVIKNNKLTISRRFEIKINNRLGDTYSEISIPYSKLSKVSKIEGCIKDKDGKIVKKLSSGDIKDRNSFDDGSFYKDEFEKDFTLVHNEYPYTLTYSYQLQEDAFLYLDRWTPVIDSDIPTLNAVLTLTVPLDYKIRYSSQLIDSTKVDTLETGIKYRWRATFKDQIESETHSPEKSRYVPRVDIVPEKFKFNQEGSFASWKTYGNWESNLLEGLNDLPEDEKQHIHSLIEGVKDDKEKIRILYHYLQDATRYINISIETGGMKPYPASYVAVNKYGDCKALTNYFKSVLSSVGISSYYTNIKAGDIITKTDLNFPSMQFNHVFLVVPLTKDTVWLECTSNSLPFNYLGTFTQNRQAYLIDKDNSHFTRTPVLSKDEVLETRNIHINSEIIDNTAASFHNKLKGESFERLTELTRSVSDSKKALIIRENFIESGFEMIDYNLIAANRDSTFILFNYTAKADKLFKKYGNELLISLVPFSIPSFKDPKNRKYPVQLDYPIYKEDSILYRIPDGYHLSSLPKNESLSTVYGSYAIRYVQKDKNIEVVKSFVLNSGEYPITQYPDFFKFVKTVYDFENYSYIVTKKQD